MDPIALRATTVLVAGIFWKFFLTTALQGYSRFVSGGRPPEDQKFGLQGEDVVQGFTVKDDGGGKAAAKMERWNRVVANDLENLPLGLILCILSCMTIQQGSATAWVHVGCCCVWARKSPSHGLFRIWIAAVENCIVRHRRGRELRVEYHGNH